ncbi:MAG TPA: hypothetical protein ENG05_01860 [Acidilobales archaeon]|nr:hypothetical protein [Acidilobales archaeon]
MVTLVLNIRLSDGKVECLVYDSKGYLIKDLKFDEKTSKLILKGFKDPIINLWSTSKGLTVIVTKSLEEVNVRRVKVNSGDVVVVE